MCSRAGKVKPDSVIDGVQEFLIALSEDFLVQCSREQLIKIILSLMSAINDCGKI